MGYHILRGRLRSMMTSCWGGTTPYQNSVAFWVIGASARDNAVTVTYERKRSGIVTNKYISTDWTNATISPTVAVGFH